MTKTTIRTSQTNPSPSNSVNRRTFATFLRLFGIWMQLVACDPAITVQEYQAEESVQGTYALVSTKD